MLNVTKCRDICFDVKVMTRNTHCNSVLKNLKDHLDKSVQTRIAMRRRMDSGGILLAKRSSVLRYLAESELPVSPCAVASVHFHCELYGGCAFCVFRRAG